MSAHSKSAFWLHAAGTQSQTHNTMESQYSLAQIGVITAYTCVPLTTRKAQWSHSWMAWSRERWFSHVLQANYHFRRLPARKDPPALGLRRSQSPQLWGGTLATAILKPLLSTLCSTRHISSSPMSWLLWPSNREAGNRLSNPNHRRMCPAHSRFVTNVGYFSSFSSDELKQTAADNSDHRRPGRQPQIKKKLFKYPRSSFV